MKTGKTLTELAVEIERQQTAKHDFLVDTREITMLNGNEINVTGHGEFAVRPRFHDQLGSHLDIPSKFYDRLQAQHPDLLDINVNRLLRAKPMKRMVRVLDEHARAFLSDRYRRLDNFDLLEHILPVLSEIPDVQFPSLEVTENRMYITALSPRLQAEIKVGDVVQAGVRVSNSETGGGMLAVDGLVYRLVCTNGMTTGDSVNKRHTGRQIESGDGAYEIFRDETLAADDHAFWLKVRDLVSAALTEARFTQVVDRLRMATTSKEIEEPSTGVQELGKRFSLSEGEQQGVLAHLIKGGDLTAYGAIQAITATAQNDSVNFDRSMELEGIGGLVLALPAREWNAIATAG